MFEFSTFLPNENFRTLKIWFSEVFKGQKITTSAQYGLSRRTFLPKELFFKYNEAAPCSPFPSPQPTTIAKPPPPLPPSPPIYALFRETPPISIFHDPPVCNFNLKCQLHFLPNFSKIYLFIYCQQLVQKNRKIEKHRTPRRFILTSLNFSDLSKFSQIVKFRRRLNKLFSNF